MLPTKNCTMLFTTIPTILTPKILSSFTLDIILCTVAAAKLPKNPMKKPGVNKEPDNIDPNSDFDTANVKASDKVPKYER